MFAACSTRGAIIESRSEVEKLDEMLWSLEHHVENWINDLYVIESSDTSAKLDPSGIRLEYMIILDHIHSAQEMLKTIDGVRATSNTVLGILHMFRYDASDEITARNSQILMRHVYKQITIIQERLERISRAKVQRVVKPGSAGGNEKIGPDDDDDAT